VNDQPFLNIRPLGSCRDRPIRPGKSPFKRTPVNRRPRKSPFKRSPVNTRARLRGELPYISKQKQHICDICGKHYVNNFNLNRHRFQKHNIPMPKGRRKAKGVVNPNENQAENLQLRDYQKPGPSKRRHSSKISVAEPPMKRNDHFDKWIDRDSDSD